MTILRELQDKRLHKDHQLSIGCISDCAKERNKNRANQDLKEVFVIHIKHPDKSSGIMHTHYAFLYDKIIAEVLDKHSNGKLYSVGCTECGYDLSFDIVFNRNRVLKGDKH